MCIPGFVFRYSKKIRRNCRPKVHYTAMSCSRRGPLRYVCGQIINPTAMILYIFGKPNRPSCASQEAFCFFGQNRRNWRRRSRHLKQRNLLMWPGQTRFESCWWQFFFLFCLTFWCIILSFSCSDFEKSGKIDVQKCKISLLSVLMQRACRGPLRHVCGHINHRTTLVHTFLESLSHLI